MDPDNASSSSSSAVHSTADMEAHAQPQMSSARRFTLLLIFCLAQFLDAFSGLALFSAIPTISADLGLSENEAVWLISAFGLTFASFLLLSGKISDIYNPKHAFVIGLATLGALSLGAGFLNSKIPLLVFRALTGCMAALTIPSALRLIVVFFPKPQEQGRAIGAFGACGSVGNAAGLIIGALLVQWASWRWVFWTIACAALPIAGVGLVMIPSSLQLETHKKLNAREKIRNLDVIGVSILTVALVLLIFAVTSGSNVGWASAEVLGPLIISIAMFVAFFFYETRIPIQHAAVPPHTWFYPNFTILFFVTFIPSVWSATVSNLFISLWQTTFHWSALSTAVHILPIGIVCFLMSFTSGAAKRLDPKWLILVAQVVALAGTLLFQFANTQDKYWRFVFPGLILGSGGAMMCYTHANIALFRASPPEVAGTVGAIFNGGLQLGTAVGYAACVTVQAAVDKKTGGGGADGFAGRKAAFQLLIGIICAEIIAVSVCMQTGKQIEAMTTKAQVIEGTKEEGKEGKVLGQDEVELEHLRRNDS